jgi:hypothetical protein
MEKLDWLQAFSLPRRAVVAGAVVMSILSTGMLSADALAKGSRGDRATGLVYSTDANRSAAKPLDNAKLSGIVYISYVARGGVDVTFVLDGTTAGNNPTLCDVAKRAVTKPCIEKNAPYDFSGGSWTDGSALPFDTDSLEDGSHTLTATVRKDVGSATRTITATFITGSGTGEGNGPSTTSTTKRPATTTSTTKPPTATTPKPTTSSTTQKPDGTADWPNANNTGPLGDYKTVYSGSLNLSNVTIENKTINGCLNITGKNVVIKNSLIQNCEGHRSVQVASSGFVTLDHVEINASGNDDAIAGGNFHLKAVHVYGANDGAKLDDNATIEDSFFQNTDQGGGCHCDALQTMGSQNVVIRHNRIDGGSGNAAIQLGTEFGSHNNFLVENNWFSGGGYTINYGNHTPALGAKNSNVVFRNNVFSPDGGWHGGRSALTHDTGLAGVTWTNNKYTDGQVITW